ncbi:ribosome biogenesis GTPase YlqF [bacterium]|nr:ribosome biogenesis GTPase YlqF [bacterium]MDY3757447.1 ribosome biogenesis GTPase YlqF [Bacilli bacterium]
MNENKTNINWYPGHMKKTKDELKKVMPYIDIVYEVIDARIPYSSKIKDIDSIIRNKTRILIMSKKDLCDINVTNSWIKYYEEMGYKVLLIDLNDQNDYKKITLLTNDLVSHINEKRKANGLKEKEIKACVLGIPNVGKSTLINKLAGKKVSKVGNLPGVTKSLTWLKTKYKLLILDTPGILWPKFDDEKVAFNLASMTAIKEDVLPIGDIAYYILNTLGKYYPEILNSRYKIDKVTDDSFDIIAKNIGAISNGEVDYTRVYKMIINDVKQEYIKGITFDRR